MVKSHELPKGEERRILEQGETIVPGEGAEMEGETLVPAMEDMDTVLIDEKTVVGMDTETVAPVDEVPMKMGDALDEDVDMDETELQAAEVNDQTIVMSEEEQKAVLAKASTVDMESARANRATVERSDEEWKAIVDADSETVRDPALSTSETSEPLPVTTGPMPATAEEKRLAHIEESKQRLHELGGTPEEPNYLERASFEKAEQTSFTVNGMTEEEFDAKMAAAAKLGVEARLTGKNGEQGPPIIFSEYRGWVKEKEQLEAKLQAANWFKETFRMGGEKARLKELEGLMEPVKVALDNVKNVTSNASNDQEDSGRGRDKVSSSRARRERGAKDIERANRTRKIG